MSLNIVADENIPFVTEAFASLGQVRTLPGRRITPAELAHADILLVRSITRVNEALLGDSPIRFVATATIGTDHVDEACLADRGIGFASAPGSNANSVAEYITAALLVWAGRRGRDLAGATLGVVGVGHVGVKVVAKARALGMNVLCNDPPRARIEGAEGFVALPDLLSRADAVTFHVPLTVDGEDATVGLIDADLLATLGPRTLLINSSRGPVQVTADLLGAQAARHAADLPPLDLVVDTWENEPTIALALLERAMLGTPHIAGYSFDGKLTGTMMIYRAACDHFGLATTWQIPGDLPGPRHPLVEIETAGLSDQEIAALAVRHAYDIEWDDASLREMTARPAAEQGAYFDGLRKNYGTRREFPAHKVRLVGDRPEAARMLSDLGFAMV
ncbi:MAG: Erythronate-4-phosphate dehydrogenase [Phycisphaerae bacterium]|nr:Erythronate-4-phosphate dehydrogenase [Phycisphaerae bacterium]